jgi:hypothetical protein
VIASMQPTHPPGCGRACRLQPTVSRIGREPLALSPIPSRTLIEAGARCGVRLGLAGGADRPDRGHAGGDAAQALGGRHAPTRSVSLRRGAGRLHRPSGAYAEFKEAPQRCQLKAGLLSATWWCSPADTRCCFRRKPDGNAANPDGLRPVPHHLRRAGELPGISFPSGQDAGCDMTVAPSVAKRRTLCADNPPGEREVRLQKWTKANRAFRAGHDRVGTRSKFAGFSKSIRERERRRFAALDTGFRFRNPGKRVLHPARPLRLRQDHASADRRRLRFSRPRRDPASAARTSRTCRRVEAAGRHGLPVLRAVPAHERGRERRLRPRAPRCAKGRDRSAASARC